MATNSTAEQRFSIIRHLGLGVVLLVIGIVGQVTGFEVLVVASLTIACLLPFYTSFNYFDKINSPSVLEQIGAYTNHELLIPLAIQLLGLAVLLNRCLSSITSGIFGQWQPAMLGFSIFAGSLLIWGISVYWLSEKRKRTLRKRREHSEKKRLENLRFEIQRTTERLLEIDFPDISEIDSEQQYLGVLADKMGGVEQILEYLIMRRYLEILEGESQFKTDGARDWLIRISILVSLLLACLFAAINYVFTL